MQGESIAKLKLCVLVSDTEPQPIVQGGLLLSSLADDVSFVIADNERRYG